MLKILMVVVIFLSVSALYLYSNEVTVSEEMILDFANKLFDEQKFDKAVIEYERILEYFPGSDKKFEVQIKIARCYKLSKDFDNAQKVLLELKSGQYDNSLIERASFELGDTYYLYGEYDDAINEFNVLSNKSNDAVMKEKSAIMSTFSYLRKDDTLDALNLISKMDLDGNYKTGNIQKLFEGVKDYSKIDRKSPRISGILSSIIPGSGHMYIKRYRDGILAFVLNSLFITSSVESFDKGYIAPGILFAVIESAIYSGTIFSSVSQTYKYNDYNRNRFIDRLENEIGFHKYSEFINN
jgi:tetratricopeptide (TPR) repeat protein